MRRGAEILRAEPSGKGLPLLNIWREEIEVRPVFATTVEDNDNGITSLMGTPAALVAKTGIPKFAQPAGGQTELAT